MITRFVILLLSCLSCFAQFEMTDAAFNVPATVATGTPFTFTNIANCKSWWYGEDWVTNSSGESWPDRSTNGYTLTQTTKTGNIGTNYLDGKKVIDFNGGNFGIMTSTAYTNAQPATVVMLIKSPGAPNSSRIFGMSAAGADFRVVNSPSFGGTLSGGSYNVECRLQTNVWKVVEIVWNSTSSKIYTNGVLASSGNAGTVAIDSARLGGYTDYAACGPITYAEVASFGVLLDSTTRSNYYNYFKTNYPSASLP